MKTLNNKLFLLLIILIITSCGASSNYNQTELSDDVIVKKIRDGYSIIPKCYEMTRGLIFYPGGLVKPDAYIPILVRIADESQIAIFIKDMPFNLAVLNQNGADKILKEYNYIDKWYIAGHSLGGVIAASYVHANPNIFEGLMLWASYPMDKKPLNSYKIDVISITGSLDGLVEKDKIISSKKLLPKQTVFIEIEGGNHAQFGSYGKQKGDNDAAISEKEQHILVSKIINDFLGGN